MEYYTGETYGNLTNIPCNNFNELTQVGLDGYGYIAVDHDNTEKLCFNSANDKFDKAFFIKQNYQPINVKSII